MPSNAKIARLACDRDANTDAGDFDTTLPLLFWRGGAAEVRCALFDGPPGPTTIITDFTGVVGIELIVRKHNALGTVLLDIILPNSLLNRTLTWVQWLQGTASGFVFSLPEQYTSVDVLPSGSLPIYFVVNVITTTSSYLGSQGYGRIVDVGLIDVQAPAFPTGFYDLEPAAAGSTTISLFRGGASVQLIPIAGPTAFSYTLILPTLGAMPGSMVDAYIEIPATANISVYVRNNTINGTIIHSVTGDTDNVKDQRVLFRYDGTAWIKFGPEVS